jgi:hypothetical protein
MNIPVLTHTPAATITHTVISLLGGHDPAIAVHHARTPDARITVTVGGILMTFYNAAAAQGLLEAFYAAKLHSAQLPAALPVTAGAHAPGTRITAAIDWTRTPTYAAAAQSGVNQLRSQTLHWVELYTAGITWQIRDRAALNAALDTLGHLHTLAIAVFLDGDQHSSDPRNDPLTAAG